MEVKIIQLRTVKLVPVCNNHNSIFMRKVISVLLFALAAWVNISAQGYLRASGKQIVDG